MYNILKKRIDPLIRLYSILPLLSAWGLNMLVYSGTMVLCANWYHFDLTTDLDRMIPVAPWFVYIYFGCFLFWVINYIMIGHLGKEHFFRFITADMMSRIICGIFFLLLPTTNIRPDVTGGTLTDNLLRFLYSTDAPFNLFPSIHCLVSWLAYIGIRGQASIPKWYRVFSCVFALSVCASTQFTKQHYIVDVFAGLAIAEGLYFVTTHTQFYRYVMQAYDWITLRLKQFLSKETSFGLKKENNT